MDVDQRPRSFAGMTTRSERWIGSSYGWVRRGLSSEWNRKLGGLSDQRATPTEPRCSSNLASREVQLNENDVRVGRA